MTTITKLAKTLVPLLGKPGLSTRRACCRRDILVAIRESRVAKKRVRVYSSAGFVPNSYRSRCSIQYVQGVKNEAGTWVFSVGWTGAQRSRGNGSLVVVQ